MKLGDYGYSITLCPQHSRYSSFAQIPISNLNIIEASRKTNHPFLIAEIRIHQQGAMTIIVSKYKHLIELKLNPRPDFLGCYFYSHINKKIREFKYPERISTIEKLVKNIKSVNTSNVWKIRIKYNNLAAQWARQQKLELHEIT